MKKSDYENPNIKKIYNNNNIRNDIKDTIKSENETNFAKLKSENETNFTKLKTENELIKNESQKIKNENELVKSRNEKIILENGKINEVNENLRLDITLLKAVTIELQSLVGLTSEPGTQKQK